MTSELARTMYMKMEWMLMMFSLWIAEQKALERS